MAYFWSISAVFLVFVCYFGYSQASPSKFKHVEFSTISAAPAFLPEPPLASSSSPSLSPDISPLFPTPGAGMPPSPSEPSIPTIPSNPSPPNPDSGMLAPGPDMEISPSGSVSPAYSPVSLSSSRSLHTVLLPVSVLLCMIRLNGK